MSNITVGVALQTTSDGDYTAASDPASRNGCDALVLSAGGLFTAYQVGVYKALWPHWRPELVVGASAGALNGWLIASHIHPDKLVEQWMDIESARSIRIRQVPSLRKGYFDPDPLLSRARSLQQNFERKLPLGVVSIEVPTFRPRLFRNEEITPEHLVASCSIPLLYPTPRIEGRRLLDGGLFEATPIWAAAAMGATRIIAINVLPGVMPWPIRMVSAAVRRFRQIPAPQATSVKLIKPSELLGSVREAVIWKTNNIRRWIELGERDGRQFLNASGGISLPFSPRSPS